MDRLIPTAWSPSANAAKDAIIGVAIGAVAVVAVSPVLGMLGFTAAGIAAGSAAAGMQTATITAGSWFAVAQSVGAAGLSYTAMGAGTAGIAAVNVAGGALRDRVVGDREPAVVAPPEA
jgi:hypothetical protein